MSGSQLLLLGGVPAAVPVDPYYEYTTLLLPGNGTNGAQNNTFLDSSTNAFTITRNGNATQGTFSPFSQTGWGNYFDGTGDFLSVANNAALDLGSGDFTIEGWWYFNDTSNQALVSKYTASNGYVVQYQSGNLRMVLGLGASDQVNSFAWTPAVNTWYHIAITRSGTSGRAFVNGTQIGTTLTFTTSNTAASTTLQIGSTQTVSELTRGYVSNFRLVKGTAVYTANFTTPTAPLTAITNTSLLTCQSNRFIDNSTNAFAITRNGDVSVQAFSPFNPTASWSAATYGGSGYFDGSGDYLTTPSSSNLAVGTGDFCVEMWVYPTASSSTQNLYTNANSSVGGDTGLGIFIWTTTAVRLASWNTAFLTTGTNVIVANQWNHIAVCRSGTTASIFVNGTRQATGTVSNNFSSTSAFVVGSAVSPGDYLTGYISNLRTVKGSSVYDPTLTTLTIPTAPLTAVTNTQLLLSYTNAGIYDATSKNDLETIGNAQISTTQSKFGGSSMYFDGNGDWVASVATAFGTFNAGNFTVECWIYSTVNQNSALIVGNRTSGVDTVWALQFYNNGTGNNILNWHSGTTIIMYANTAASINTWNHVAVSRSGTSLKMYLNGTEVASATDTRNYSSITPIQVGYESFAATSGIGYYNGYINDIRITKGIARYTSNFTPPTTAFPTL